MCLTPPPPPPRPAPQPEQAALDAAKFSQLEALLSRSQMYTQFLTEQIDVVEEEKQAAAESALAAKGAAAKGAAGGRKRKAGAAGAAAGAKKGKQDMEALTQVGGRVCLCVGLNVLPAALPLF